MPEERHYGKRLLSLGNHHAEGCGVPPHVTEKPGQYVGYFENEHGEQAIFVYDRPTRQGTLYMGDYDWETPLEVVTGGVPGLVISEGERVWLRTCWEAATGEHLQPTLMETFLDLLRQAQSTNPAAVAKLNEKIEALKLVPVGYPRPARKG